MPLLAGISSIEIYAEDDVVRVTAMYSLPRWRVDEQQPFTVACPSCRLLDGGSTLRLLERACWEQLLLALLAARLMGARGEEARKYLHLAAGCYRTLTTLYHVKRLAPPWIIDSVRSLVSTLVRMERLLHGAAVRLRDEVSCGSPRERLFTVDEEAGLALLGDEVVSIGNALRRHVIVVRWGARLARIEMRDLSRIPRLPSRAEYALLLDGRPVETGPLARLKMLMRSSSGECVEACGVKLCIDEESVRVVMRGVIHQGSITVDLGFLSSGESPAASRLYALYIDALVSSIYACRSISLTRSNAITGMPHVNEAFHGPRIVWGVAGNRYVYTLPCMYNVYSTIDEIGLNPPFASMARAVCTEKPRLRAELLLALLSMYTHCGSVRVMVKKGRAVEVRKLEPPRVQKGGVF